jgi:trimeric autotransporter adhesin
MATIVTKNSSTASAVPTTSDLVQGELAVNVTDKRIFTENASTQIVELGTNPSSITTATATVTGTLTANGTFASSNAVITGGSVNSTPIGATTPSTIVGSTVTANTGFVGGLTGNVTGNLTGNVTGNVNGNLTGNVTGNVTASSGTTTLNDLVVNGTADFTNTKLTNITTPTVGSDAANKSYVDDTVAAVIDSAPAALDTLNELAAALGDDANFAGTVTTALATKLPLAGGTMTGAIAMGTSKITGLGNPTSAQDAATKTYVDTADALKLNLTGGTMSGAIAMGTNKITGVGNPTLAQDAATKDYVDDILGSATSAATSAAAAATSASNAATSASNAASSATASANSASAAAASYDAFDDRYLGDKASDPTLDNDGNALLTGALYFNTTSDVMKVYDGSAWNIAAISSASPTFTGTVTADGLSLGDNDKATFGNSNDLEIYHDGSHARLREITGDFRIQTTSGGVNALVAKQNAEVEITYAGSTKLATTSTGIDVTGTATMDGLTVDGSSTIAINSSSVDSLKVKRTEIGGGVRLKLENGDSNYYQLQNNGAEFFSIDYNGANRLGIANNGDISFYEDTGTTPKFFWDASAERLGLGTTSPSHEVHLVSDSPVLQIEANSSGAPELRLVNTLRDYRVYTSGSDLVFRDATALSNRVILDSSGNLLVGKTASNTNVAGMELRPSIAVFTADGNRALQINRLNSDGELQRFIKDGINVGSIGSSNGGERLYMVNDSTGFSFLGDFSRILPCDSAGAARDAAIDLGQGSGGRFKDLYLSNAAYINGITVGRGAGAVASNTAVGSDALAANTTGAYNTATGTQALYSNTTGTNNTANGFQSLLSNTTGVQNVANGVLALFSNTTGSNNVAIGKEALYSNTTGNNNTANGLQALLSNTTGSNNVANGFQALYLNTTGGNNVANGFQSLYSNTTGTQNTASGNYSLYTNSTGNSNTAIGYDALLSNTEGSNNTATGLQALRLNTTGFSNVATGSFSLLNNTTGTNNAAFGLQALFNTTTGSGNIGIGFINNAGTYAPVFDPTTENNRVVMGHTAVTNAYVQVAWTVVSDARDKMNFAPVPHGLDFVKQLNPVAYQFKIDRDTETPNGNVRYGFKAQDILALEGDNPVIIDNEDEDKLKYNGESLVPVLVKAMQEQQAIIESLTNRIAALEGN